MTSSSSSAGSRTSGGPNAALFRPLGLEPGTWYSVFISSNEGGPADFSLQLASWGKKLEQLMADINSCELRQLGPTAVQAGAACLARYTVDSTIYRAVILQRADTVKVCLLCYSICNDDSSTCGKMSSNFVDSLSKRVQYQY